MASPSAPNNVSAELGPSLVHQMSPSGTLLCAVWDDSAFGASVEGVFLAPSVGPADPPQVVSSLLSYLVLTSV